MDVVIYFAKKALIYLLKQEGPYFTDKMSENVTSTHMRCEACGLCYTLLYGGSVSFRYYV